MKSTASALAMALTLSVSAPVLAQSGMVAQPNPDADQLAGHVRRVAASPRDVAALLDAGDVSVRLGDTSAALAFFARAEAVDPTNPRIHAGRAATLVRMQRPGEALRLFQRAEAGGLAPRAYASDRGLAYDLLGAPDLAQRDYQLALANFRDDETIRRYALSLGITGDVDKSMLELDPLLRRSDRAAWRARAFVLAMNDDLPGADKIATTMMPTSMGAALSPFFRRLAVLSPADRAFGVHFGELSPTQARLADARLAPPVSRWVPAPKPKTPPAVVAAAAPAATVRGRGQQAQPRITDRRGTRTPSASARAAQAATPVPVIVAAAPAPTVPPLPAPPVYVDRTPIVQPIPTPQPVAEHTPPPAPRPTPVAKPEPRVVVAAPAVVPAAPAPASAPVPASALSRATPPAPSAAEGQDSVLAAIIGEIVIPAEELEALNRVAVAEPAPVPAPLPVRVREPAPKPAAAVAPKPAAVAAKPAVKPEPKKPEPKKPEPKKPEPKKPDPAKTDPSRIWVQVAGGANVATLDRAYSAAAAKAPAVFAGKSAWWTTLRATNRVLVGPFKTSGEAQAFVNSVTKAGGSGFVFTSEAGQKVTRLNGK